LPKTTSAVANTKTKMTQPILLGLQRIKVFFVVVGNAEAAELTLAHVLKVRFGELL
jgi:hypothetical protein